MKEIIGTNQVVDKSRLIWMIIWVKMSDLVQITSRFRVFYYHDIGYIIKIYILSGKKQK